MFDRMGRVKKEPERKVAFKTKDGKEVCFAPKGKMVVKRAAHMKALEKRLTAMEKAVLNYNHAVQVHEERKKSEGGKQGDRKVASKGDKPGKGKKAGQVVVDVGKERA